MNAQHAQWLNDYAPEILDAVVDAILTIDARGRIQSVNAAATRQFGYSESELIGEPLTMLMPEPYRSAHQRFVENYLATGSAQIIGIGRELEAEAKDGHVFPIYLAVSEIQTEEGTYFAGIIRDLTAEKAAEEAMLEQRERLSQVARLSTMGEMTASIAHEINQPLTAISMYAQACVKLLQMDDLDRRKLVDALTKLNRQALRAGAVIERIQRFVRHEDGERQLVDMNALVKDLSHLAAGDARLHGIDLHFDLAEGLPNVLCDPIQVQQVALNLIRNAIDAMHEVGCANGHRLEVRTVDHGGMVEVAVVDCGTGVAEEHMDLLFSAFHTTKQDGMGMGLSICRSIIEDHGGELNFRNNDTCGCTFYFRLPVEADA